jgi:hypothetical protein
MARLSAHVAIAAEPFPVISSVSQGFDCWSLLLLLLLLLLLQLLLRLFPSSGPTFCCHARSSVGFVSPILHEAPRAGVAQHRAPIGVPYHELTVADHQKAVLGAGESHVEPVRVFQEADGSGQNSFDVKVR